VTAGFHRESYADPNMQHSFTQRTFTTNRATQNRLNTLAIQCIFNLTIYQSAHSLLSKRAAIILDWSA